MIPFDRLTLSNGLRVLHHHDTVTRMVAVNLLYGVGSRCEAPHRTGLAHLNEHLMFSGSAHAPSFDDALQVAGGTANAWTSVDATNYYEVLPAHNVATALWLERDRLLHLTLAPDSVEVQRRVVTEEFKQRCLNVPYGDLNHLAHKLAYDVYPYRWPTIGADLGDIAAITRDDILAFREKYYAVDNAILCVAGNVTREQAFDLAERWFGDIPSAHVPVVQLPAEPPQRGPRELEVTRDVPGDVLQMAFHMCGRCHPDFVVCDLISDLLANGKSARFTRNILGVCDTFAELDAAVEGTIDPGLFVVRGRLAPGQSMAEGEKLIWRELHRLVHEAASPNEIAKCANKYQSTSCFENLGCLPKATRLCQCEQLGDAALANTELQRYRAVEPADVQRVAAELFVSQACSTVRYFKRQ